MLVETVSNSMSAPVRRLGDQQLNNWFLTSCKTLEAGHPSSNRPGSVFLLCDAFFFDHDHADRSFLVELNFCVRALRRHSVKLAGSATFVRILIDPANALLVRGPKVVAGESVFQADVQFTVGDGGGRAGEGPLLSDF